MTYDNHKLFNFELYILPFVPTSLQIHLNVNLIIVQKKSKF